MSITRYLACAALLLVLCPIGFGQKPGGVENEVRAAMARFITVFTNLEWQPFIDSFSEDATVFFPPSARTINRATGKTEVAAVFKITFENFRRRKSTPPYFTVEPRDMKVQVYDRTAIVTFHVDENSRRTLVFRRLGKRWLIVHLHGSSVSIPE